MAFSELTPEKWVGRIPADRVSQEKGLNLSSRKKAARPPDAGLRFGEAADCRWRRWRWRRRVALSLLVESKEAYLQIVSAKFAQNLPGLRHRSRCGDRWWRWDSRWARSRSRRVAMKEGRDREQKFRVEGVDPGSIDQGIGFAVAVAEAAAVYCVSVSGSSVFQIIERDRRGPGSNPCAGQ